MAGCVPYLYNIFSKYNEFIKINAILYNPKFRINIYKRDKTFNKFYVKFIITILLFKLSDIYKILNLKRIINIRIYYKLVNGIIYNIFSDFV